LNGALRLGVHQAMAMYRMTQVYITLWNVRPEVALPFGSERTRGGSCAPKSGRTFRSLYASRSRCRERQACR
jgi:hypothetical protein